MNDDELSAFLMGEVPEPGGDFFEDLSARLHEINEEEAAAAAAEGAEQVDHDDGNRADNHQGPKLTAEDGVIIDLSEARERRNRRWNTGAAWRSAAAAVALIAGGAIAFDALGDDDFQTAASDSPSETTEQPVDSTPGDSTSDTSNTTVDDEQPDDVDITGQTCLTSGEDLLVIQFGPTETDPFTGVATIGNAVSTISGIRLDPGNPDAVTYLVNSSAIGSAEEGAPIVDEQLWYGGEGISINGSFFSEVTCDAVAEQANQLLSFVGDERPATPTTPTTIRSCYIHADEILVLDLDTAYMIYTGARTNLDSIEALSAQATGTTATGESVLDVRSSPLGSAEEDGGPIVNQLEWLKSDARAEILAGDQMFAQVESCDSLGDRFSQLDNLVSTYPPIIE